MRAFRSIPWVLALVVLQGVFFSGSASAQATRTWVSGVGDDANPCSRTAPCKTFAGAISKTAAGGEINAMDSGGFGAVTITKSITIDGGNGNIAGVLVAGSNGITVSAGPTDVVTLRNLDIDGLAGLGAIGVDYVSGGAVRIEASSIYGFSSQGVDAETSTASQLFLKDVSIHECGVEGVQASTSGGAVQVVLDNVSLTRNAVGLGAGSNAQVSVRNSVIAGSTTGAGVHASSTAIVDVTNSTIASNKVGVRGDSGGATIYLSNVDLFNNPANIQAFTGAHIVSYGNNRNTASATPGAPTSTLTQQ